MVSMLIYLSLRFHLICVWIFGFNNGYLYFFLRSCILSCLKLSRFMAFAIGIIKGLMFICLMTSMLIYPWMCFHLGPKPHWTLMADWCNSTLILFPINLGNKNRTQYCYKVSNSISYCFIHGNDITIMVWGLVNKTWQSQTIRLLFPHEL